MQDIHHFFGLKLCKTTPEAAVPDHDPGTAETASQSARRKPSPSIFRDTFCPAKHSIPCTRYLSRPHFVQDLAKSVSGRCENEAVARDDPQRPSKSESGRCESKAFVRDIPQNLKAEDVKTKLSCEASLKNEKIEDVKTKPSCETSQKN